MQILWYDGLFVFTILLFDFVVDIGSSTESVLLLLLLVDISTDVPKDGSTDSVLPCVGHGFCGPLLWAASEL